MSKLSSTANLNGLLAETKSIPKLDELSVFSFQEVPKEYSLTVGHMLRTQASSREAIKSPTSRPKLLINRFKPIRITHSKSPIDIRINRSRPVSLRDTLHSIRDRQRSADKLLLDCRRRNRKFSQYGHDVADISDDIAFLKNNVIDSTISAS